MHERRESLSTPKTWSLNFNERRTGALNSFFVRKCSNCRTRVVIREKTKMIVARFQKLFASDVVNLTTVYTGLIVGVFSQHALGNHPRLSEGEHPCIERMDTFEK